ncbi:hypothetical protein JCM19239_6057 [Vibrio variabilis]|uniref:Uncharacterized protein n=1 Tax=Vibrio variabilis TaxID=990271 RepID=A0ABQ0JLT1_9VIBR|nr:hypothetical protein JCM19239_6057 [Vibrio variabilis]
MFYKYLERFGMPWPVGKYPQAHRQRNKKSCSIAYWRCLRMVLPPFQMATA